MAGRARRLRRVRAVRRQRVGVRAALRRPADGAPRVRGRRRRPPPQRAGVGRRRRPSWCSCTAAPRTPTRGTRSPWPSAGRWWPSTCPATATPTAAREGQLDLASNAADVAVAIRALAPDAKAVIGMSLGGMTTIALARAGARPGAVDGARRHHARRDGREGQGDHRLRQRAGVVPELRRPAGPDDGAQPDPHRGVVAARHPAQRRAARGRLVGVALRPPPRARPERRATGASERVTDRSRPVGRHRRAHRAACCSCAACDRSRSSTTATRPSCCARLPAATVVHVQEAGHSVQGDTPIELAADHRRLRALTAAPRRSPGRVRAQATVR